MNHRWIVSQIKNPIKPISHLPNHFKWLYVSPPTTSYHVSQPKTPPSNFSFSIRHFQLSLTQKLSKLNINSIRYQATLKTNKQQNTQILFTMIQIETQKKLLILVITYGLLSCTTESIRFELQSSHSKCIAEELKVNSMTVGKYSVINPNEDIPLPDFHKVTVRVFFFFFFYIFLDFL